MEEVVDILDDTGSVIGKASKELVHQKGYWHKGVHIWIINSKNELLIQKRGPAVSAYPNLWDMSSGGHVDAGETSLNAALRETREELGLAGITNADFHLIFSFKDSFVLHDGKYINNEFDDVYLTRMSPPDFKFRLQNSELSQIKWIEAGKLKDLLRQHPDLFVPREYEYSRLFNYLNE